MQHLLCSNGQNKLVTYEGRFVWLYDTIQDMEDAAAPVNVLHMYYPLVMAQTLTLALSR